MWTEEGKRKQKKGKKTELVCVHMTIHVLAVLTVCCELSSHTGEMPSLQVKLDAKPVACAKKRAPRVIV